MLERRERGGKHTAEFGLLGFFLVDAFRQDGGVLVLVHEHVSSAMGFFFKNNPRFHFQRQNPKNGRREEFGGGNLKKRTAASLEASALRRFRARRWRLCCRRCGVTRRWMRGALVYDFLPSVLGWTSRRMTNLRT